MAEWGVGRTGSDVRCERSPVGSRHNLPGDEPGKRPQKAAMAHSDTDLMVDPLRDEFAKEAIQHLDTLYGAALRLTRSASDADDLVQDAFLKAYRFYDRFEPGTNLRAWLLRILTNTFINKYRRTHREKKVLDGDDAEPVGDGVMSRAAMRALQDPDGEAMRSLVTAGLQASSKDEALHWVATLLTRAGGGWGRRGRAGKREVMSSLRTSLRKWHRIGNPRP